MERHVLESRLLDFSLRAVVGFSSRCARRALPICVYLRPGLRGDLGRAIADAEAFARAVHDRDQAAGELLVILATASPGCEFKRGAGSPNTLSAALEAAREADLLLDRGLVLAAGEAVGDQVVTSLSDAPDDRARQSSRDAHRRAIRTALGILDEADRAEHLDIDRLARWSEGEAMISGPGIDPSDRGPLGPLWPEGPPEWIRHPPRLSRTPPRGARRTGSPYFTKITPTAARSARVSLPAGTSHDSH